jgi:plastocyanin
MKPKMKWVLAVLMALAAPVAWAKNYTVSAGGVVDSGGYGYGGTTDVLQFQPASLTIQAGDTVTFTNMGGTHNIVSDTPGLFRCANGCDGTGGSGAPANDWSVTIPFNNAGTFGYHCELHQAMGMKGTIVVTAAPQATFAITPGITGSWYNADQSGHGFNIEVLPNNIFLAYWYVFDTSGKNLWLGGVSNGAFSGNSATVNLTQTTGGTYPPLDPTKIVRTAWGTLTFAFTDCNNGSATWTPGVAGFPSGTMPIKRLTNVSGITCP